MEARNSEPCVQSNRAEFRLKMWEMWQGRERMNLNFDSVLKWMWYRWTELNCWHSLFRVTVLYKELKLRIIFHCSEHGQLNGQLAISN
jgi:hypothetical protein